MKFSRIFFFLILVVGMSMEAARVTHRPKSAKAFHATTAKRKIALKIALNKAAQHHRQQFVNLHKKVKKKLVKPAAKRIHHTLNAAKVHVAINVLPDQFCLPKRLQGLNKATIRHLRVTRQIGNQCCSRTIVNALATQDLLNLGLALTASNIRTQAQLYGNILEDRLCYPTDAFNMAKDNHLLNGYIKWPNVPFYSIDNGVESLYGLSNKIRNNNTITAHIIDAIDEHAVLITIIKKPGAIPQIIYMDSNNIALQDNSVATADIIYFYNNAIA